MPTEQGRKPDALGSLRQGDRAEAACRVPPDLLGPLDRIGQERDAQRNDPFGVGRVPLLEEPVIPRPGDGQAELGIGALREHPAAESRDHRREAQRCPHPVDVHVGDPSLDVPAPPPHLLEAEGLETVGVRAASGHRVHPDLGEPAAVELPHLVALVVLDDARRPVGETGFEAALEHVGGLDEVVVHRDDGVFDLARRRIGEEQVLESLVGGRHAEAPCAVGRVWAPVADGTRTVSIYRTASRRPGDRATHRRRYEAGVADQARTPAFRPNCRMLSPSLTWVILSSSSR